MSWLRSYTPWTFGWRVGVVALVFALVQSIPVWLGGGLPAALLRPIALQVLAGVLFAVTVGLMAIRVRASRGRHALVWGSALYLNTIGVVIEGYVFVPDLVPPEALVGAVVFQLLLAVAAGTAVGWLFASPATARDETLFPPLPGVARLATGVVGAVVAYAVTYFVVGGLNYAFLTGPYYERELAGLATPPLDVVLAVVVLRALLFVGSLLLLVRTVGDPRNRVVLSVVSLSLLAMAIPLLVQVGTLPPVVLVASTYEILLQVGPTAVVIAVLLGRGAAGSPRAELARVWSGGS